MKNLLFAIVLFCSSLGVTAQSNITANEAKAITANVMEREREACLNAGMDDHVGKPINRDRLRDAIQKWI